MTKEMRIDNDLILLDQEDWDNLKNKITRLNSDKGGVKIFFKNEYKYLSKFYPCRLHRYILNIHNDGLNKRVYHINNNKLDNRKSNLQLVEY